MYNCFKRIFFLFFYLKIFVSFFVYSNRIKSENKLGLKLKTHKIEDDKSNQADSYFILAIKKHF